MKPCPFCAGTKVSTVEDAQGKWTVQCLDCLACGPRLSNVEAIAVTDWDERAEFGKENEVQK